MADLDKIVVLVWLIALVMMHLKNRERIEVLHAEVKYVQELCAAKGGGKDESHHVQESNQGAGQG